MKEKNFFAPTDENDFMPIISISENDNEDKDLVIPNTIALLPLRNTVLYPGVVLPITVSRDKSIKAVNDAYKGDKLIGVISQKDVAIEEPEAKDLCKIGTVAKIIKLIKMPDGGTTIIIQGKKRFEINNIINNEPYFTANITVLEDEVFANIIIYY
jgi:ATP-dependent Lon protease